MSSFRKVYEHPDAEAARRDAEWDAEMALDRERLTEAEFKAKWPLAHSAIVEFLGGFGKVR